MYNNSNKLKWVLLDRTRWASRNKPGNQVKDNRNHNSSSSSRNLNLNLNLSLNLRSHNHNSLANHNPNIHHSKAPKLALRHPVANTRQLRRQRRLHHHNRLRNSYKTRSSSSSNHKISLNSLANHNLSRVLVQRSHR